LRGVAVHWGGRIWQSLAIGREVATLYDFSVFRSVMDVGGGYGAVLRAIFSESVPSGCSVIETAPETVEAAPFPGAVKLLR
jgi:hypothetical protein